MGMPAARVTDMHVCPMITVLVPHVGGPILPPCAPTVLTGFLPQARVTDMCVCVGPPDVIVTGAWTVLVSGLPAARIGDMTVHGGAIVAGLPTVLIGDNGSSAAGSGSAGGGAIGMGTGGKDALDFTPWKTSIGQGKQAKTLKQSARRGTPFCEQCPN